MTTIKFERDNTSPKTSRNYRVLIDGEHRATFTRRTSYYTLDGADGEGIKLKRKHGGLHPWAFTKMDFTTTIEDALAQGTMPTRAQIDRALMIEQAHKENNERDRAIAARRAQVRVETVRAALTMYIHSNSGDAEHTDMALAMLREYDNPLRFV